MPQHIETSADGDAPSDCDFTASCSPFNHLPQPSLTKAKVSSTGANDEIRVPVYPRRGVEFKL